MFTSIVCKGWQGNPAIHAHAHLNCQYHTQIILISSKSFVWYSQVGTLRQWMLSKESPMFDKYIHNFLTVFICAFSNLFIALLQKKTTLLKICSVVSCHSYIWSLDELWYQTEYSSIPYWKVGIDLNRGVCVALCFPQGLQIRRMSIAKKRQMDAGILESDLIVAKEVPWENLVSRPSS